MKPAFTKLKLSVMFSSLIVAMIACNNSDFAGEAGQERKKIIPSKKGEEAKPDKYDPADSDNSLNPTNSDDVKQNGDQNTNANNDNLSNNGDGATGLASGEDCLAKKADNYNLVLVFDNSASQLRTDPNGVRRQGALRFVEKFVGYNESLKAKNKPIKIQIGAVGFSQTAVQGSNGSIVLSKDTQSRISDDITALTANPEGGTMYTPALKIADTLQSAMGSRPQTARERSYVIFLTDGEPQIPEFCPGGGLISDLPVLGSGGRLCEQTETRDDIKNSVNQMVNSYGAAVLVVAAGQDIGGGLLQKDAATDLMKSMALPTVNTAKPKHLGKYIRSKTASELDKAWDELFELVTQCE